MGRHLFLNGKLVDDLLEGVVLHQPSTPAPRASKAEGATSHNDDAVPKPWSLEALLADTKRRFVALSLQNCPQCEELAAALALRGVPGDVFVKWDKTAKEYPEQKAAVAAYAGNVFSFPQVFVDGSYQGGYREVLAKLEAGSYDEVLSDEFKATPVTVERWISAQDMVVFSLPNCPQCDELREMLQARGLPVEKIFMKWDKAMPQYQSLKAQLIQLIGKTSFTFPQTFVHSEYQGSFAEVSEKLEQGHLDSFFQEAFGLMRAPIEQQAAPPALDIAFDEDF